MDAQSLARLSEVHSVLADKIKKLYEMLQQEGIEIRVTQGLRPWAVQQALFDQGRDKNGNVVDPSQIVTKARAGQSWHNFGLAVDVAPFTNGIPDWNVSHPVWGRIAAVGDSLGLVSGSEWRTFPDWPHFELTGRFGVSPDDEVRYIFKEGGIQAVWDATFGG